MSLIDQLLSAGRDAAIAAAADPSWVPALVERARPLVAERLDGGWRTAAEAALDALEANAGVVSHLGAQGLVGLTMAWSAGGETEAREAWLRHHATGEEIAYAWAAANGEALASGGGPTWSDVAEVLRAVAGALPALIPILGLVV